MGLSASEVLAVNLRKLVERAGSQVALAEATHVPQKTISRALNAENAANLDTLNDLAHGLGLEPWRLLSPDFNPHVVEAISKPPETLLPMPSTEFGKLIKQRRIACELTQTDVANHVGVTEGAVSHWEQGRVEGISAPHLVALSRLLDLDATDTVKQMMRLAPQAPLPADDLELIEQLRSLPAEIRHQIRALISTLAKTVGK